MDFVFLPPEINSGRMYSGPGSGPMLAAAGSWDSLAAELDTATQIYQSVLSGLTSLHWHGPASVAMAASTTPYIAWLHTTAEQAKQTSMQARAAAAAYELAHAMTVPPPAVTANRVQLAALVATNFFAQNTAAIAATEAQYAEYWAQDAAAMSGYAASSTAASQLTPFTSPGQHSNSAGLSAQSAAVAQATASPAASNPWLLSPFEALGALLTAPLNAINPALVDVSSLDIFIAIALVDTAISGSFRVQAVVSNVIRAESDLGILPNLGAPKAEPEVPRLTPKASGTLTGGSLGKVSAKLSRASTIGSMSVPASWAVPSGSPVSAIAEGGLGAPEASAEPALGSAMSGIPGMPAMRGSRPSIVVPRYGERIVSVMCRPPAAG